MKKTCSRCHTVFECENSLSCWCFDTPKLTEEQLDDKDCLCKDCLLAEYKEKLINGI